VRLFLDGGEQPDHQECELDYTAKEVARKRNALLKETEASVVGPAGTTVGVLSY
jgi:hypothetical protein